MAGKQDGRRDRPDSPIRAAGVHGAAPCPCGSGLKWKKCTCAKYHPEGSHTEG